VRHWLFTAVLSSAAWIVCETLGGLFFLALGLRLWSYHVLPICWDITSPMIWLIIFLGMPPFLLVWNRIESVSNWTAPQRVLYRCLFLAITGPIVEVLINDYIFRPLGTPLYLYTYLETFNGSGSWLSPLYYLTLYIHFPIGERLGMGGVPSLQVKTEAAI